MNAVRTVRSRSQEDEAWCHACGTLDVLGDSAHPNRVRSAARRHAARHGHRVYVYLSYSVSYDGSGAATDVEPEEPR